MTVSNAVLRTSVCCSIPKFGAHRKWQTYEKSVSASDFAQTGTKRMDLSKC